MKSSPSLDIYRVIYEKKDRKIEKKIVKKNSSMAVHENVGKAANEQIAFSHSTAFCK